MLESDLRALFERQASSEPTPAPISIPAAQRIGRVRLRRRRASTFGTPVLAAGAVVAVIVAGSFASGPASGTQPPRSRPTATTAAAPTSFSLVRPYVRLGWIPARMWHTSTELNPTNVILGFANPPGQLIAFSARQCHVAGHVLACPQVYGDIASQVRQSLSHEVGLVRGHPAYWAANGPILSVTGNGSRADTHINERDGVLAWQYGRGGWAIVYALTPRTALRIASAARFGPMVAAPLTFPVQVTGVAATWHESNASEGWAKWGAVVYAGFSGPLAMPGVGAGLSTGESSCRQDLAYATKVSTRVINGDIVYTYWPTNAHPPEWNLCAPNADGLTVSMTATPGRWDRAATLVSMFAHMRLLGRNPARWTTDPIAP